MKNSMNAVMKAELLRNHPKNPRKDLGDLEELTKSIRKNGIMQNLTVIPVDAEGKCVTIEDGLEYWVLIGNRRFQAGLNAGLFEFPCNIVENLSEKEQEECNQLNRRTEFTVLRTTYGMFDEKGQLKELPKPKKQEKESLDDDGFDYFLE